MTCFLKTSPFCNSNCIYCEQIGKKHAAFKTFKEIEKELIGVKKQGFDSIRLSCNTDARKDFLKILQLTKKYDFSVILETNGENFSRADFCQMAGGYVDQYEIYFNCHNAFLHRIMSGAGNQYKKFTTGVGNITKFAKDKKSLTAKIVLVEPNLHYLFSIVDKIKQSGIRQIKFALPFRLHYDYVLPMADVIFPIQAVKNYAKKKGIKILIDHELENYPYFPDDISFFDTNTAKTEINFVKYKNKPKFSIIIPTFNRRNCLKHVLDSFFKQNYPKPKYEIIVIDDGSTDWTFEMIKKIKPTCNFKYFYWPRKKIALKDNFKKFAAFYNRAGLARNIGINNAKGEIILFSDADIVATRDCLKKHEAHHRKYLNIIVRGFRMFLPDKFNFRGKNIQDFSLLDRISRPEKTKRGRELCCRMHNLSKEGWHRIVTADLSIRKNYLERIGGFNKDFVFWGSEDTDLGYRLAGLKMKFIWDDKIKVYHLYHSKESGGNFNDLLISWLNINILYRKHLDWKLYRILVEGITRRLDDLILD